MNSIVWRDSWAWWTYFVKLLLLSMLIPITLIISRWNSFMSTDIANKLSFVALVLVSLFGILMLTTHRLSLVSNQGIYLGTVTRDDHMENPKLSFRKFFSWGNIKKLRIYKKKCKRSFGISDFVATLEITPKKGKKFESYINNIAGFQSALDEQGKKTLLIKESYLGPSTTNIKFKDFKSPQYIQVVYRIILGIILILLGKAILGRFFGI